jgi:hypothetical protein
MMQVEDQGVEEPPTLAVDKVAQAYISLRDARAEAKRVFEAQDEVLAEQMQVLETHLLDVCKQINADSIRTKAGTVIRSVKTRYWTNDWDSMYRLIHDRQAFGLLEKRLHQSNMKQFLEENPEVFPEGLNQDKEYTVVVRRAK